MVFKKILAGVVAGALAVGSMALTAFAAPLGESTVEEAGGGITAWQASTELNDLTDEELVSVDKVVATLTTDSYVQAVIGGNTVAKDGWDSMSAAKEINTASTDDVIWENVGGLKDKDSLQVQFWWQNAGTTTVDKVVLYDEDGEVIIELEGEDDPSTGDEVDTSAWQIALKGFDNNWEGWGEVDSETGELEFSITVQDILDVNDFEIDDLYGINVEMIGVGDDDVVYYKVTINEEEVANDKATGSYLTTITTDDYSFAADDVIVVIVSAKEITDEVGGDDEEDEPENLWEDEDGADVGTDWAWDSMIVIPAANFANTAEGDTISITFDINDATDVAMLKIVTQEDSDPYDVHVLTSPEGLDGDVIIVTESPLTFVLNAADLEMIQKWGVRIGGYNVTVFSVDRTPVSSNNNNNNNNTDDEEEDNTPTQSPSYVVTAATEATTTTAADNSAPSAGTTTTQAPATADNNGAGAGTDGNNGAASGSEGNPATGVVFAFIPALAAAAGVMISKKRK